MSIEEITIKSIVYDGLATFESQEGWFDEAVRERLATHLADVLEERDARANGVNGCYDFAWHSIAFWALGALQEKYDVEAFTDADMQALAREMVGDEYIFHDDEKYDYALCRAARVVKLPRIPGAEDDDDEDEFEMWF